MGKEFGQERMVAHQGEERYRELVDNLSEGVFQMSPEGKFISANSALAVMLGYDSPDDMMTSVADRYLFHASAEVVSDYASRLAEHGFVENYEAPVYQKSGSIIWFSTNSRSISNDDGTIHHYEGTVVDITARMAAEEALRESEERYRNLVGNLSEGIFQMTLEGEYISANSALADMLGYDSPDDLMTTVVNRKQLHPDPELAAEYADLLNKNGYVENFEAPIFQKSGSIIWVSTNSRMVLNDDGSRNHYAGTVVDITARKAAEDALQQQSQVFFNISKILAEPKSYDEKLDLLMEELLRVAESAWVSLRVPDPDGNDPRLVALAGALPFPDFGSEASAFVTSAMESGEPVVVNNYQAQPGPQPWATSIGVNSLVTLPIKGTSETVGVASVISREVDHFSPERVRLLTGIVDGLGPLLENAKLDEQIREELELRRLTEAKLLQRSEELEALFKISSILAKPGGFEDKLPSAMQELARVAEAAWVTLRIRNPVETEAASYVISITPEGQEAPSLPDRRQRPSASAVEAIATGEPVVINDYRSYPNALPLNITEGIGSAMSCPIKVNEATIGVISVVSKESDHFNPERVQILTSVADGLGVFLEKAGLDGEISAELERRRLTEAELLQRSKELEALFSISKILAQPGSFEDNLSQAMEVVLRVSDALRANLRIPDTQQGVLRVVASVGNDVDTIPMVELGGPGIISKAFESGAPVLANDYSTNPDAIPKTAEYTKSAIALPITATGETLGVVVVVGEETNHFNPERVRLLAGIVDGLGPLLENARLNEEITTKEEALRQSQKLESVGQLAAGVAHEVNNPLSTILGFSKLLLGQDISESAKNDVQIIFDEAQRGTTIIQDLLSFARKGTSEKKNIDITGGLKRVLNLKAADFRANHVKVDLEIEESLPDILADEQQLQQVYLNLLTNAQHAMFDANDGGNIAIKCRRVNDVLRLSFVDDGPGMTKEIIDKIFDPFFTTKPVGVGTGLGLSVCYGIIEDHDGRFWVESEPGTGATFFIELPCLAEMESST